MVGKITAALAVALRPLLYLICIGADGLAADIAARCRVPAIRRRRLPARDRAVLLYAKLALRQRTPRDELIKRRLCHET
jgi:hypothetical protein